MLWQRWQGSRPNPALPSGVIEGRLQSLPSQNWTQPPYQDWMVVSIFGRGVFGRGVTVGNGMPRRSGRFCWPASETYKSAIPNPQLPSKIADRKHVDLYHSRPPSRPFCKKPGLSTCSVSKLICGGFEWDLRNGGVEFSSVGKTPIRSCPTERVRRG